MGRYADRAGLSVAEPLVRFLEDRVLPGSGLDADAFWKGTARIFTELAPENFALLKKRDTLQAEIDAWHRARRGQKVDAKAYREFLSGIGYLVPEPAPFTIGVENVDEELALAAGPQLVVPVLNARFLLNAANARWGSLYDALYGTDAIPGKPAGAGYDPKRGSQVIAWARGFLDRAVPLASGSHGDVAVYRVEGGKLTPALADPSCFAGYRGEAASPSAILLRHNGIHIELRIDRAHPVGKTDKAGLADVILEAAITTIADLEDSIAAVDAGDKVAAYANWLGLMQGDLEAEFEKSGRSMTRTLAPDRTYTAPDGGMLTLPGRSLMLIRNVGHLLDHAPAHPDADFLTRYFPHAQAECDVLEDGAVWEQSVALEHHAHAAMPRFQVRDIQPGDHHPAGRGLQQPRNDIQRRGFAAPARAEQTYELAIVYRETDRPDGGHVPIALDDAVENQDGLGDAGFPDRAFRCPALPSANAPGRGRDS